MTNQIVPIEFKPGILRDGSKFQGQYCVDGQWVRFFEGRAENIGGMATITNFQSSVAVNRLYISGNTYFFGLDKKENHKSLNIINNNIEVDTSGVNAILPINCLWHFIPMISNINSQKNTKIICLATKNLTDITSDLSAVTNEWPLYFYENGTLTKYNLNANIVKTITGGMLFILPNLFFYGNDGLLRWSKQTGKVNIPLEFDANNYSINISTDKVIHGSPIRGGQKSPAMLFWTLSSVIRVTNTGTPETDSNNYQFKTEIISNDSSIISSNCVVEYDGIFYWIGTGRFFLYNGVVVPLENTMNRQCFFNNVDMSKRQLIFGVKNSLKDEIWWFYPEKDQANDVGCTRAVIYNIIDNSWYDTAISRNSGYFDNVSGKMFTTGKNLVNISQEDISDEKTYLWEHEVASDQVNNHFNGGEGASDAKVKPIPSYFTTPIISYVTYNNLKQTSGVDRNIQVKRIEPNFIFFDNEKSNLTVTYNSYEYPMSLRQSSDPVIIAGNIEGDHVVFDKINYYWQGRNINFTFKSEGIGSSYEMADSFIMIDIGDGR